MRVLKTLAYMIWRRLHNNTESCANVISDSTVLNIISQQEDASFEYDMMAGYDHAIIYLFINILLFYNITIWGVNKSSSNTFQKEKNLHYIVVLLNVLITTPFHNS